MRQDRQGVRTAQDLERKYKLAEMRKMFELSDNTIVTINKIIENFVNTIVGTLDNFEGVEDGQIATYFYDGTPTLETLPTSAWEDEFENHVNDMYYDREQGKAYTFTMSEGVFSWVEVTDEDKIKVLAMANATRDAEDHKRRIFLEQPLPPYDNGDLWLKDGVIYACQISKPITEVYEKYDFILYAQYSGDTLALKVGTELEVLRGTVLKIIEDTDFLKVELKDLDANTTSNIELLMKSLSTLITDEQGQSMMTQTSDGWQFSMKSYIEKMNSNSDSIEEVKSDVEGTKADVENVASQVKSLEEKTTYINMGTRAGQPCIELGAVDSDFKIIITNTEILFVVGSNVPAYFTNEALCISKAIVENEMQIGSMAWVKRPNKHISFLPKGVI